MQGHTIEARKADGVLIGLIKVPPRDQRPFNAMISWICGLCGEFGDFGLSYRGEAVETLSRHLETEHADFGNPIFFVLQTSGAVLSSEDGMSLDELRQFLTETS